jgi:hypothetical protein
VFCQIRQQFLSTFISQPSLLVAIAVSISRAGADAFYRGEIARAMVAKSDALGGTMTLSDLADYRGEWVEPAVTRYHGLDIEGNPRILGAGSAVDVFSDEAIYRPMKSRAGPGSPWKTR